MNTSVSQEPRPGAAPGKEGGLAPKTGARIFFDLGKNDGLATLTITIRDDTRHILKQIRLVERVDKIINDLVADIYVNGVYVMSMAEGPETPWFFDSEDLAKTIRDHGEIWTYKSVLGWFKHPIDELEEEVRA